MKIFVMEGCPACEKIKEVYRDEIERGEVELLDVANDEKARQTAIELGINKVPTPVSEDGSVCVFDEEKKVNCNVDDRTRYLQELVEKLRFGA